MSVEVMHVPLVEIVIHVWGLSPAVENMVARDGVELPTPAFSGLRTISLSLLFFNLTLQSGSSFVTIL
jgi:hypothetical protein